MNPRPNLLVAALCLALGLGGAASAQIANSNDPIEITAEDSAEYFRSEGRIVYKKNVRATQGQSQITSDTLTVLCSRGGTRPDGKRDESCNEISSIIAEGRVRYATPTETITGDRIEYDARNEVLTVTGDVILNRSEEGVARGTRVVYNVRDGRATITSDNRPVTAIFESPSRDR